MKVVVADSRKRKLTIRARNGYFANQPSAPPVQSIVCSPRVTAPAQVSEAAPKRPERVLAEPLREAPEITSRDVPVTFKSTLNLVQVPVVVRGSKGAAIGTLRPKDFEVFDKNRRQRITNFSVETAGKPGVPARSSTPEAPAGEAGPAVPPERFVALVFDDIHLSFVNLAQVRDAARRKLNTLLGAADRVAIYTTSGRASLEFTDNRAQLEETLLKVRPSPMTGFSIPCLRVSYFQARTIDQQVGLNPRPEDVQMCIALQMAIKDAGACLPRNPDLFHLALQSVRDALTSGAQESSGALSVMSDIVRRMAAMPGQRSILLVSPGFYLSPDLEPPAAALIERAIRAKVRVSAVNALGVWTDPAFEAGAAGPPIPGEIGFRQIDFSAANETLLILADGTGGSVSQDNDFDGGIQRLAAAPEYLYVLGFTPDTLKPDGSFHSLKVKLAGGNKLRVQARRGYWAPKLSQNPVEAATQEIENAVFSRDELRDLPVELQTQIAKHGDTNTELNVAASLDLQQIRLSKASGRNQNDVTVVWALFDRNGNFVSGSQKTVQLRLKDETVERFADAHMITVKTTFDMKPGSYLVRMVARDAEGQQMAAQNGAVEIP